MAIGFNGFDRDGYDMWGYNKRGFNRQGFNRDGYYVAGFDCNGFSRGYDRQGFDINGNDRQGFGRDGYNTIGVDRKGFRRGELYDREGYDRQGFNEAGFNKQGFGRDGYNVEGFDYNGFRRDGYDRAGYDRQGFKAGFNRQGFGRDGYNVEGFDCNGFRRDGYDRAGYDRHGFNKAGFNEKGFGRNGYNVKGFDRAGIGRDGYDIAGFDRSGFNIAGFDKNGFGRDGYDVKGFDRDGFGRDGYDIIGFDRSGFNRAGFDKNGFGRDGFDQEGYNRSGYNKVGINRKGFISFSKWQEIVNSTTPQPSYPNMWSAEIPYSELDDQDFALAENWANDEKDNDYTMARMLSARSAEKIAIKFYQSLGFEVSDVSIKQPVNDSNNPQNTILNDWKLYDLLLNGEISIDVKNARTPLNSKVSYVEHCVSRFKKNRNNKNIIIVGILSPYLKLSEIQNPQEIHYEASIKYLGETTSLIFSNLEERFSKRFLKLSFTAMNFIPRWMFEFPEKFYETRNQCRLKLQRVSIEKIPKIAECRENGVNPIPAYLSSGFNLPDIWKTDLNDWQVDFYARIRPRDNSAVTMPVLFLALLVHFLEAVTRDKKWNEYEPELYRQLLYTNLSTVENWQMPLGIFDPLGIIENFIKTLSILWNNKEHTNLREFELFKFNGVGLLEGKRLNKQKYETILAYCGGFIEGIGKCGNTPLILGKHESCTGCGKLICEKCGYCSANCQQCEGRMKSVSKAPGCSVAQSAYHDLSHYEENRFEDEVPF